eukprot:scaffold33402_cov42-Phaeocystis_antarctica.AAC.1
MSSARALRVGMDCNRARRRRTRARGTSPRVYPLPGAPDVLRRGSACLHKTPRLEGLARAPRLLCEARPCPWRAWSGRPH